MLFYLQVVAARYQGAAMQPTPITFYLALIVMTETPENPALPTFTPELHVTLPRSCRRSAVEQSAAGSTRDPHPWAIALRQFPARPQIIGQFRNRQDAEDQLRALRRLMLHLDLAMLFLPPEETAYLPKP